MTTLIILILVGLGLYLVLRGRKDAPEQLGAAHRPLPMAPLEPHTFPCPHPKCATCGASGDKMKQEWDGLRSVKWTCGYCGALAGVQTLKDEELPPSARRMLGLDAPNPGAAPMPQGYGQDNGMGGLLTGMMIGSMMGGGHHHHHHDPSRGGDGEGWTGGDSGGSDWGDGGSGGSDWGDGGDFGGGDSGGGDW